MQGKYDIIVNVKPFSQAVKAVDFDSISASSILARAVSGDKYDRANIIIGNAY